MTCFKLTDGLLDDIEAMILGYFLGMKDNKRKISWVSFLNMTKGENDGGLSFRDLKAFNLVLLSKQGWRRLTQSHSLLLKAKYYHNSSFLDAPLGQKLSGCR